MGVWAADWGKEVGNLPSQDVDSPLQSSILTYEDKSLYDKAATSISEQQLEGTESSQADMQSRKELEKLDKEQEEEQPTGEPGCQAKAGWAGSEGPRAAFQGAEGPRRGLERREFPQAFDVQ